VVVAGRNTSEIFIENGRFHGRQIARNLLLKLGVPAGSRWSQEQTPEPTPGAPLRNAE